VPANFSKVRHTRVRLHRRSLQFAPKLYSGRASREVGHRVSSVLIVGCGHTHEKGPALPLLVIGGSLGSARYEPRRG